jgi:hypothetical protein
MEQSNIIFKIDTTKSLSVEGFSNALLAFNDEYKRFSDYNKQLVISEIRKGSYEVEFSSIILPTLFAISQTNSVVDFIEHIKVVKDYLIGKNTSDKVPDMKSIENTKSITGPIINYGTLNIISGDIHVTIPNNEAKTIEDNALKAISKIKQIDSDYIVGNTTNIFKKKLFYWYQACFDEKKANKGNKGIIESIQKDAENVIFEDDNSKTKKEMTTSYGGLDWQKRGYIIDVEVLKKGNKIMKYKILHNYMDESVVDDEFTLF